MTKKDQRQLHLDSAIHALETGNFSLALTLLKPLFRVTQSLPVARDDLLHWTAIAQTQTGQHANALKTIQKAIGLNPSASVFYNTLGNIHLALFHYNEAISAYKNAITQDPHAIAAHMNCGLAYLKLQKYQEAGTSLDQAILLDPSIAEYWLHRGTVWQAQDEFQQAEACYEHALKLFPQYSLALNALGVLFHRQGKLAPAMSTYERARQLDPENPDILSNLGKLYAESGRASDALRFYDQALKIIPTHVQTLYNKAVLFWMTDFPLSLDLFRQVIQHNPLHVAARLALAQTLLERGEIEKARVELRVTSTHFPSLKTRLASALFLPSVYQSQAQLLACRKRLRKNIASLQAEMIEKTDETIPEVNPLFYLVYQGLNDRAILSELTTLYQRWLPHTMDGVKREPSRDGKIHIGFICKALRTHSVSLFFENLISHIPRDRFEVTLFFVPGSLLVQNTQPLRDAVDQSFLLTGSLDENYRTIVDQQLDILVYTDLGMESRTYTLAMTRLAPVQCVLLGHPDTSGISTIDYYISSDLFEPPNAQDHYSETLIQLPGMPVEYTRPVMPETKKNRAALGLPEACTLYTCPMVPFKLHPAFDPVLGEILRRDPGAEMILFERNGTLIHERLLSRFRKTIPAVVDRIHFVRPFPFPDFLSFFTAVDAVLFPFPFEGGNTGLQVFSTGTPLITMDGEFLRGRWCVGFYKRMGILDCIAKTPDEYVELALRLAHDKEWKTSISQRIQEASPILFNNREGINALFDFWTGCCHPHATF